MSMTTTTTRPTEAICPPWCAGHEGVYHGWETLTDTGKKVRDHSPAEYPIIGGLAVMLVQIEHEDTGMSAPGVAVDSDTMDTAHTMTDAEAHELGMAIVRAADVARRYRMAAQA